MESLAKTLLVAAFACAVLLQTSGAVKYQEVIDVISARREIISKHPFFAYLADESISPERRLQFMPYWTYYAMGFADILDSWIRIENPKNELEERVNAFANEDNFHYNFFLHDVEKVLGYTLERYGSYEAVVRQLWSDETKTVRQYYYEWASQVKKYDDPIVTLTTFETSEAGLKDIFEVAFTHVHLPEDGLKELKYFGLEHVALEVNHSVTAWFAGGETPFRPLADIEITEEQRDNCIAVANALMDR